MMEFYAVQIPEILALKLKYLKVWQKFSWYDSTMVRRLFIQTNRPDSGATGSF